MNAFVRFVYAILIAISVVTFIGIGSITFYSQPDYPTSPKYVRITAQTGTAEYRSQVDANDKIRSDFQPKLDEYHKKQHEYYRNLAIIALPLGLISLGMGLLLIKRADVLGEGLGLGGIATSIFALFMASSGDSNPMRFISVTMMLLGVIALSQRKFLESKF